VPGFKVDKNLENANNLYYILNIDSNNVRMGEMDMSMVTVSSKYQVVIPKPVSILNPFSAQLACLYF